MSLEQRKNWLQLQNGAGYAMRPDKTSRVPYPAVFMKCKQALSLMSGAICTTSELMSIIYVQTCGVDTWCKCSESDLLELNRVCETTGGAEKQWLVGNKNGDNKPARFRYIEQHQRQAREFCQKNSVSHDLTSFEIAQFSCAWGLASMPALPILLHSANKKQATEALYRFQRYQSVQVQNLVRLLHDVKSAHDGMSDEAWEALMNGLQSSDPERNAKRAKHQAAAFSKLGVDDSGG